MTLFDEANCTIDVGKIGDVFWAKAPANIALIKYMGKRCADFNLADNVSLSFTLRDKLVKVELELAEKWSWESLVDFGEMAFLSVDEQDRFLNFAEYVAKDLGISECFLVKSAGNFPSNCGVASSAASFAALTSALAIAALELNSGLELDLNQIINLSRCGSGSSCRSFFYDWVVWDKQVSFLTTNYDNCLHQLVVISAANKVISSSSAHLMVKTSLMYSDRSKRSFARYLLIKDSLLNRGWDVIFEQSWQDFWDMHSLFHTAYPAFSYLLPGTIMVLNKVRSHWDKFGDGPIATLDAGANVHLLYRAGQADLMSYFKNDFDKIYQVI